MANGDRKARAEADSATGAGSAAHQELRRIAQLQDENERLRRLATDLLLEKLKLEEALGQKTK